MVNINNKKKKGQSTLEYMLLLTGVVVVMILFLGPNQEFSKRYQDTFNQATDSMVNMGKRLRDSRK